MTRYQHMVPRQTDVALLPSMLFCRQPLLCPAASGTKPLAKHTLGVIEVSKSTSKLSTYVLQAVAQTVNIEKGNVQLKKAIKLSTTARKLTAVMMLVASLLVLGFDWYAS